MTRPGPSTLGGASSEQPTWVSALGEALAEALPRLHGCGRDPALEEVIAALTTALVEGRVQLSLRDPEQLSVVSASALSTGPWAPLVLEGDQLCWRRWQQQRDAVLEALLSRALGASAEGQTSEPLAQELLESIGSGLDPQQRQAVVAVLEQRLVLLEGGPGTGKTSTVSRMLAAVRARSPASRIHLAAPTGKAAARLRAAIAVQHPQLPCSTLHRLLESRGEGFGRHRHNPLALDLLVVDEVSMLDLPLMQALLEALPQACQLVLVGDSAQLPPVGPGAVLLELQAPERRRALGAAAVQLHTTYRNNGAIAELAAWLRQQLEEHGDSAPTRSRGSSATSPDSPAGETLEAWLAGLDPQANLHWQRQPAERLPATLIDRLRRQQLQLAALSAADQLDRPEGAAALLGQLDCCIALSPVHGGRWGVDAVHRALLGQLAERSARHWPAGTPVLCRQNQPDLGLANGDVGVAVDRGGERRLLFAPAGGDTPLWIHPAQLPAASPALALSVHKAQGSEYEEVWVLMPATGRPAIRLLYTALTRARRRAELLTPQTP